ncbi:MAG: hypothetical protein KTR13_00415 [Saprospiraceae bacterium]|nr:hypothetical protein [Saprospiraceae bacterium]
MASKTTRICLWSGPRNISTALMYSFAQRKDTTVFDEPLYGYYLANTDAQEYHPGAEEVLHSMEQNGEQVIKDMMAFDDSPVVFFKNMTHHLLGLDTSFLKECINVLLTRNPMEMLPSFDAVIEQPTMKDVGYDLQADLLDRLESRNIDPIVLDGTLFLKNPEGVFKQLCSKAAIPFDPNMLQWKAGPRPEDGVWAKYWYKSVHASTGFVPYKAKEAVFPTRLEALLAECQPYYDRIVKRALR